VTQIPPRTDAGWRLLRDDPTSVGPAIKVERCSAVHDSGLLCCGREKGHGGYHSVPVIDTAFTYMWPQT
jgi:hypothetical protein